MVSNKVLLFTVLHLGVLLPVTEESRRQYGVVGESVTLNCPTNPTDKRVIWKYNGNRMIWYIQEKIWKNEVPGYANTRYNLKDAAHRDFSLVLPNAQKGLYTCEATENQSTPPIQRSTIDLEMLEVTASPKGSLLQGETLDLKLLNLRPTDLTTQVIEWRTPGDVKITGEQPRWSLRDNSQRLQIKALELQDQGNWNCRIPAWGLTVRYGIKVLGFNDGLDLERRFAAVNSTVSLSYPLSTNLEHEKKSIALSWKRFLNNTTLVTPIPINANSSIPVVEFPSVQFENAGFYQCQLRVARGSLNKTFQLVVMKVFFAPPLGPLAKEGEASLCCQISAPVPSGALLHWHPLNKAKELQHGDDMFCHVAKSARLWRCSLNVDGEVKISINYTMEVPDPPRNSFPLREVALGVGALLLLLLITLGTCLVTHVAFKRKRQRIERIAQIKQCLIEKRTCQCRRELESDYCHAWQKMENV